MSLDFFICEMGIGSLFTLEPAHDWPVTNEYAIVGIWLMVTFLSASIVSTEFYMVYSGCPQQV